MKKRTQNKLIKLNENLTKLQDQANEILNELEQGTELHEVVEALANFDLEDFIY